MDMQLLGIFMMLHKGCKRTIDYQEIICTTHAEDRYELCDYITKNMVTITSDLCFWNKRRRTYSLFNTYIDAAWCVECGAFATDKLEIIGKPLTKHVIKVIIPMLQEIGTHRVEAQSIVGYEEVHEWLGFSRIETRIYASWIWQKWREFHKFCVGKKKREGNAKWQARKS